jgi:hypothetical protein
MILRYNDNVSCDPFADYYDESWGRGGVCDSCLIGFEMVVLYVFIYGSRCCLTYNTALENSDCLMPKRDIIMNKWPRKGEGNIKLQLKKGGGFCTNFFDGLRRFTGRGKVIDRLGCDG